MHDVLRKRLLSRIESLPERRIYQVLDYIEFLEEKYGDREAEREATGFQRFAEKLEDGLRKRTVSPAIMREAFQLLAAADRGLSNVSAAGRRFLRDLNGSGESLEDKPGPGGEPGDRPGHSKSSSSHSRTASRREDEDASR